MNIPLTCSLEAPRYQFIIVNRLSTEDLTEAITSDCQVQDEAPYVMFGNGGVTYALWFYDQKERERIGQFIEK